MQWAHVFYYIPICKELTSHYIRAPAVPSRPINGNKSNLIRQELGIYIYAKLRKRRRDKFAHIRTCLTALKPQDSRLPFGALKFCLL